MAPDRAGFSVPADPALGTGPNLLHSLRRGILARSAARAGHASTADALNEVKRLGKAQPGAHPGADRDRVLWSDFSYTAMPPGHWHEIAVTLARGSRAQGTRNRPTLALIGLAQADAAIVCWDTKYRWNLWRPITAIQRAAEDGNPLTDPDPSWEHFLVSHPSRPTPAGTARSARRAPRC